MKIKQSVGERIFMVFSIAILVLSICICLFPFIYVFSNSISDPTNVINMSVVLFPKGFSLKSYEMIFENNQVWSSYGNTILYSVVGTILNLFTTILFAYPLSRRDFCGRSFFMVFITITMFFSGGLIPLFITIQNLGIYDTYWAVLLPMGINTWNVIITRTFMQGIPTSLQESARIDGCNDLRILFSIIIPLSYPIIAVVALYSAVAFWNMYFLPMVFTPSVDLQPLQLYLMKIVIQNSSEGMGSIQGYERLLSGAQLKYSIIMVAILPIVCVYPFVQKYFIKGVMIGALKG